MGLNNFVYRERQRLFNTHTTRYLDETEDVAACVALYDSNASYGAFAPDGYIFLKSDIDNDNCDDLQTIVTDTLLSTHVMRLTVYVNGPATGLIALINACNKLSVSVSFLHDFGDKKVVQELRKESDYIDEVEVLEFDYEDDEYVDEELIDAEL